MSAATATVYRVEPSAHLDLVIEVIRREDPAAVIVVEAVAS